MRSVWKGSLGFGMVSIPTKLYPATENKRISFHQIHSECGSRIKMPKWCPVCDRAVESFELKKGYEISKDQHIILDEGDFEALPLNSLKTIEVVEFVDGADIDTRCYSDCYLLSCEDTGSKAFTLFLNAMTKLNLVGIAKLTYRDREHLSAIQPYDGIMLLQTLHYADELRAYDEIKPREVTISEKESDLAESLVKAMIAKFELAKYQNEYREALMQLIEAKMSGEVITAPTANKPPVGDVADQLIASLNLVGVK